jgi:hypothetical protein
MASNLIKLKVAESSITYLVIRSDVRGAISFICGVTYASSSENSTMDVSLAQGRNYILEERVLKLSSFLVSF